jgi:hypothetical protein
MVALTDFKNGLMFYKDLIIRVILALSTCFAGLHNHSNNPFKNLDLRQSDG